MNKLIKLGDLVEIPYYEGDWEVVDIWYKNSKGETVELTECKEPIIDGGNVFVIVKGKGYDFLFKEVSLCQS